MKTFLLAVAAAAALCGSVWAVPNYEPGPSRLADPRPHVRPGTPHYPHPYHPHVRPYYPQPVYPYYIHVPGRGGYWVYPSYPRPYPYYPAPYPYYPKRPRL